MSAKNPRRVGVPAFPEKKTGLRLLKNPDERPRPEPDPELKAIVEDLNRHARAQRELIGSESGSNDAA